jgi:anthraniloyl-CoA monooxygenase
LFNGSSHVVLMGDAVHTAHFAIGSGTKLALEDAIELTRQFKQAKEESRDGDMAGVLQRYQALREVDVLRLQNAAWNAMEWFEVVGQRYCDQLPPEQFMYSMLTRSQRISHENLRLHATAPGSKATSAGSRSAPAWPCRRARSRRARCSRPSRCAV